MIRVVILSFICAGLLVTGIIYLSQDYVERTKAQVINIRQKQEELLFRIRMAQARLGQIEYEYRSMLVHSRQIREAVELNALEYAHKVDYCVKLVEVQR